MAPRLPTTARHFRSRDWPNRSLARWGSVSPPPSAIHASQGGEADIVIYLITRSNGSYDWGFLNAPDRTNVALTRAKRLV
eukprot:636189-Pyramimonas_sp.AAC.1